MPFIELPFDPEILSTLDWHQDELFGERKEDVIDAVERLPKLQREIVNGLFYEGLFKKDLVDRLGISKPMLDKHLALAVGKLRHALS